MKLRTFGLLLLLLVGVVPIAIAGLIVVKRAERTALDGVRLGNYRVAVRAASELGSVVEGQAQIIGTLVAPLTRSVKADPAQVRRILKNFRILHPNFRSLDVVGFGQGCREAVTSRVDAELHDRCNQVAVHTALSGQTFFGNIVLSSDFTPTMTFGVPLGIAGEQLGAAIADIDMLEISPAVKQIRVGTTGFARLVSRDGTLIAHGDPEERRRVFLREKDPFAEAIRKAPAGQGMRYVNSQHRDVIALAATVPRLGWSVIVEQPVAEAFGEARQMRDDVVRTVIAAATLAILLGVFGGGPVVRILDRMRAHARRVAEGELESRIAPLPPLREFKQLAVDLNEMASELKRLNDEMKAKERLNTFARVAAGLAHDLQSPIESVRAACDMMLAKPDDETSHELLKSASVNYLPRLHRYVRDLRRLAADGKVPLELVSVNPRGLAERVVAEAASSPKWQGIEFVADGDAAAFWADESLLRRAVSNLVANAADACVMQRPPRGRVTVRVADDHEDSMIFVQDTGVGIPADKLADLMVNDFKSSKRNSGVGLGLGVARHVAGSHGGTITAESIEGSGTTFIIRLPRKAAAGVAADVERKEIRG